MLTNSSIRKIVESGETAFGSAGSKGFFFGNEAIDLVSDNGEVSKHVHLTPVAVATGRCLMLHSRRNNSITCSEVSQQSEINLPVISCGLSQYESFSWRNLKSKVHANNLNSIAELKYEKLKNEIMKEPDSTSTHMINLITMKTLTYMNTLTFMNTYFI